MLFRRLMCVSAVVLLSSCSTEFNQASDSDVKQIVPSYFKCDTDQERAAMVKEKYGSFFRGSGINAAYYAAANIPDVILDYVFTKRSTSISLRGLGRGGVTNYSGSRISISTGVGSLAHELGHAAHFSYFRDKVASFDSALRTAYNYGVRYERSGMRGYSTQKAGEFMADSFDSYYCSKASRENFKKRFPKSYAFAKKYYPAPPSEEASEVSEEELTPKDSDGDGITDDKDRCANTPEGANVWKEGEFIGCAGGQTRD